MLYRSDASFRLRFRITLYKVLKFGCNSTKTGYWTGEAALSNASVTKTEKRQDCLFNRIIRCSSMIKVSQKSSLKIVVQNRLGYDLDCKLS